MSKRRDFARTNRDLQPRSGTSIPLPLGVPAGMAITVVAAFLAYLTVLNGGFILDDQILLENKLTKTSDGLWRFWCTTEAIDYWPMTNTTYWIEWRLWAKNPTGYHVTNLILHIVESLLIWLILRKLSIPGAFLAALIFTVHPVNVESVAWIAQRKNMMAMLFFLLSVFWYLKFLERARRPTFPPKAECPVAAKQTLPTVHSPPSTYSSLIPHPSSFRPWYWLSLAAFVLAMLSKGSVVIMPVLLLGIVWWLRTPGTVPIFVETKMGLSPSLRSDLLRTAPFFVVAVVLGGVNVWFQTHGTEVVVRSASSVERLLGAGGVVWFYIYKALLPLDLVFVYPQWRIEVGDPSWWLPLSAAFAVTAVFWLYRTGWSRPFLFAWGFFCVAIAPVMGFADVGFMKYSLVADHYQHIAIIGLIALATAGFRTWHQQSRHGMHRAATFIAIVVVGALTFLTWRQCSIYRDDFALYNATLEKNPDFCLGQHNLGNALVQTGRPQEAIKYFQKTLRLKPDFHEAYLNLGIALAKAGRPQEAIEQFKHVLRLKPDYYEAQNNLGTVLVQMDRNEEAIECYQQALRMNPDPTIAYVNLAVAYAKMHKSSEAIAAAQKALELARSQQQTALSKQIENWLNSYRASLSNLPGTPPPSKSTPPSP